MYIFSDRVEFVSPGGLVSGMRISDLGKKSMPRNVLLFGLLQRMDLVEKAGSGILRIKQAMKEYRLPASKIEADENWFTVTFSRPNLQKQSYEERMGLKVRGVEKGVKRGVEKGVEKLTKSQQIILKLIKNDPSISKQKIQEKGKLSKKTVDYNIDKLKELGWLNRVGSARGGHWEIE